MTDNQYMMTVKFFGKGSADFELGFVGSISAVQILAVSEYLRFLAEENLREQRMAELVHSQQKEQIVKL